MVNLQALTQRFFDKGVSGFKGATLQRSPEVNRFSFVWETKLSQSEFQALNDSLVFESHTVASSFSSTPVWQQFTEGAVGFYFDAAEVGDDLSESVQHFNFDEVISLADSPFWKVVAYFPSVESPESLNPALHEAVMSFCESFGKEPVWVVPSLKEGNEKPSLALRLMGDLALEELRTSFFDAAFVGENSGEEADWALSLMDLRKLGFTSEQVLEKFNALDDSVPLKEEEMSEEVQTVSEKIPDSSSLVKDYGVVEDTLLKKKLVFFKLGPNAIEYRYDCHLTDENGSQLDAEEALEAYLDDVKQSGSLGVSYNRFVKHSRDWHEVMTSRQSNVERGMDATYISPKQISSSITAAKSHQKNVDYRTGKRVK